VRSDTKPSKRCGRSSGRLSGTATTTPIVGVAPAPPTPPPASSPPRRDTPYPVVPVTNLTAGVRGHPRSVGHNPGGSAHSRNCRKGLLTLEGTPETGRLTRYPGRGAPWRFPSLLPPPGLSGFGEPRGPTCAGCRTRSPTMWCWRSTRWQPTRCCTGQAGASRSRCASRSTTVGLRRRCWITARSRRPGSRWLPTPRAARWRVGPVAAAAAGG
jgi:hypothetical protein